MGKWLHQHIKPPIIFALAGAILLAIFPQLVPQVAAWPIFILAAIAFVISGVLILRNELGLRKATSEAAISGVSSGESIREATKAKTQEDIVAGLDNTLIQMEKFYHRLGEKAINLSADDYEKLYLANREDWAGIKNRYPNLDAAVWAGLATCFTYHPSSLKIIHMKQKLQTTTINPLLMEAESSNPELGSLKSEINKYLVMFKDRQLFEMTEVFRFTLEQRETSRIMHQLATRFSMSSNHVQPHYDLWKETDKAVPLARAVIQKRVQTLMKPWWIRWLYA